MSGLPLDLEIQNKNLLAEIGSLNDLREALRETAVQSSQIAERALARIEKMQPLVDAALSWAADPNSVNKGFALHQEAEKYMTKAPS